MKKPRHRAEVARKHLAPRVKLRGLINRLVNGRKRRIK